ncbi:MAG: phosphate butyryltransferase [Clostridiaceae bacterium]
MINNFDEIFERTKVYRRKKVAVAVAEDEPVLEAIKGAFEKSIADAILVGDSEKIKLILNKLDMDEKDYEIIDVKDPRKAALKAVELVSTKKADMVMKGLIDTKTFLRAVLDKNIGLRTGKLMSHVAVFKTEKIDRLLFITDAAFNIAPDLKAKIDIVNNSVLMARAVGIEKPKVAAICAVEVVNPEMQATIDAAVLTQMNRRGQIKGCIIDGPLGLDNAISIEAAKHKKISGEVPGNADIFLMPNIETGNVMYKTLTYASNSENGGIVLGTCAPVILTSRADSFKSKLNSIALAALVSEEINKGGL